MDTINLAAGHRYALIKSNGPVSMATTGRLANSQQIPHCCDAPDGCWRAAPDFDADVLF
jgi:hypothetical protein